MSMILRIAGNHYRIYPQPDLPAAVDAFLWLLIWLKWLEFAHYERPLAPDDCVFPVMGANGVVHPREPLSHDNVQKWINEAVEGAGIPGSFSTHCFRRGGAQYRFMFTPIGQRWTLAKVRWWGGWAEQEHVCVPIPFFFPVLDVRLTWIIITAQHAHSLPSRRAVCIRS